MIVAKECSDGCIEVTFTDDDGNVQRKVKYTRKRFKEICASKGVPVWF